MTAPQLPALIEDGSRDPDALAIGDLYRRGRQSMVESVRYLIEAGKRLKAKKDALGHGHWLPWVEKNAEVLGFGDRTAERVLGAAKFDAGVEYDETEAKRISRSIWGHTVRKPTSKSSDDENQQQQPEEEVLQEVLQDTLDDAASSLAWAAARGAAADIAGVVLADRNLRSAFAKIAPPGWLAAFAAALDAAPPPKVRKIKLHEMSVAKAVTGAYSELVALGEECRGVVDNAPPGISETQRIQTLDQTASELEGLEAPDVPDTIGGIVLQIPIGTRPRSRAERAAAASEELQAVVKALEAIPENDDRYDDARELLPGVQEVIDVLDGGIEFPRMFQ